MFLSLVSLSAVCAENPESTTNTVAIAENLTSDEIQKAIDSAGTGATIEFKGDSYDNVHLDISKTLKLVSNVSTTLNGVDGKSIISINGISASNTMIKGFILNGGSNAIEISGLAKNVSVNSNKIVNSQNGIKIDIGSDIHIENNTIINVKDNAISLRYASNVNINGNTISNNKNGIYFDESNKGIIITNNIIEKGSVSGINLMNGIENSVIRNNTITSNKIGISADSNGATVTIFENYIGSNDDGIAFGENYRKTSDGKDIQIYDNSIIYNNDFNIHGKYSIYNSFYVGGPNWVGTTDNTFTKVCIKIKTGFYGLNFNQVDSGTLEVTMDNKNIPAFTLSVSFDGGKTFEAVTVENGYGIIHASEGDGNLVIRGGTSYYYTLENYSPYVPEEVNSSTEDVNSSSTEGSQTTENTNGTTTTTDVEGGESQTTTDSSSYVGDSSTAISSVSASSTQEASSASETSSSSNMETSASATSEPADAQESESEDSSKSVSKVINVDDEDDNIRVAGIAAIILVILAMIGLYYRNDIKEMMNNKNN